MPPNLLILRKAVCIEFFLPIGWHTFIWWKIPPKRCTILVWIAVCPPNIKCIVPAFFRDRFGEKDCSLCKYNQSAEEVGWLDGFLYEGVQNFEPVAVYSNIYCASLRAVNPPNLLCKEYGKLVARILQYIACYDRV